MLIYIANLIISALVGTLLLISKDLSDTTIFLNIILLILTLETPTFYLLMTNRKSLDKNDNELLAPSALIVGTAFLINIIFYSTCLILNSSDLKLLILYTVIINCIMVSILLVVKALTDYIKKQHR